MIETKSLRRAEPAAHESPVSHDVHAIAVGTIGDTETSAVSCDTFAP
jgi:hypothetical protein